MSNVIIRVFVPADGKMVRTICCDTADRGGPVESLFPDREMAADLLTKYYTDYEPSSCFVAEYEGKLVGYILGCLDNRRYGLVLFWILIPKILVKGFARGLFFRPEFWRIMAGTVRNWRRLFAWRKGSFHSHQGHLHIAVVSGFRGQKIGQRLVAALLNYARIRGIKELAASVHGGNNDACRFFDHMGFEIKERYSMIESAGDRKGPYQSLLYVKRIN